MVPREGKRNKGKTRRGGMWRRAQPKGKFRGERFDRAVFHDPCLASPNYFEMSPGVYEVCVEHVDRTGDIIHMSVVRLTSDPFDYEDMKNFEHPSEWFDYCNDCGKLLVGTPPFSGKTGPEREDWRYRGWDCPECEGKVWWVKDELCQSLFLRNMPTYFIARGYTGPCMQVESPQTTSLNVWEDRLTLRIVGWCLWCRRPILKLHDVYSACGSHWDVDRPGHDQE